MCIGNVLPWRPRQACLQVNAGLVPSDIWRLQLLDEDDDDPNKEHKVYLMGKKIKVNVAVPDKGLCTPLTGHKADHRFTFMRSV